MKKFIAYLLLLFIVPMAMEAKKKEFAPGLYWEVVNNNVLVISGRGAIPDYSVDKYGRAGTAPWNEKRIYENVYSLRIEEGITAIGNNAFNAEYYCYNTKYATSSSLSSVALPSSLERIGDKAFAYTAIESIDLPNSISKMGKEAFRYSKLSKIKIPQSWSKIPPYAFADCHKLEEVIFSSKLKTIGESAFYNCGLRSVALPEGVEEIDSKAFKKCSLNNVLLPNSLKTIGPNAFEGQKMQTIEFPENITTIGEGAFSDCEYLTSIQLPQNLKNIAAYAFMHCNALESVMMTNSVTAIGKYAFATCKNLKEIYISSNAKCGKEILSQVYHNCFNGVIYNLPEQITESNSTDFGISSSAVRRCRNGENGVINSKGQKILEAKSGRKVKIFSASNAPKTLYHVTDGDEQGIIDEDGNWFIPLTKGRRISRHETPLYYEISDNEILSRMDANGKWIITPDKGCRSIKEMEINSKTYYLVSKAKYSGPYGLLSATGNQIFPCEYEQLSHAGGQFLKFKIGSYYGIMKQNGDVVIPTSRGYTSIGDYVSSQNVFAYTANGYKGEVDGNGVEKSHIKVETPKQQTASTKPSTSTSSTASTTTTTQSSTPKQQTIVVEHHRDPQPMQVWHQCTACYGSGTCKLCGGNGWNPYSYANGRYDRCLSCGGRGKCSYCAGQGGHYEVEYR